MINKQLFAYFMLKEMGACDMAKMVLSDDWQLGAIRAIDALQSLMFADQVAALDGIKCAVRVARNEQRNYHPGKPDPYTKAVIEDALYDVICAQFATEATQMQWRKYAQLGESTGHIDADIGQAYQPSLDLPF